MTFGILAYVRMHMSQLWLGASVHSDAGDELDFATISHGHCRVNLCWQCPECHSKIDAVNLEAALSGIHVNVDCHASTILVKLGSIRSHVIGLITIQHLRTAQLQKCMYV